MNPLLGLVMIVKDEFHGLRETLESFLPYVDRITILDTGSRDGTQEIIREVLKKIPGELFEEPFVDFSTSRNRALELHGESTTFVIMPDSDDRLVNGDALRTFLACTSPQTNGFLVNIRRGDLSYYLPLVTPTSMKWRYRGVVHEFCAPESGGLAHIKIPDVQITQNPKPQSREASRKRWERDLGLLTTEHNNNPKDARTLFYLAQTYECLDQPARALGFYEDRIALDGWAEETFESHFRCAKILQSLGFPDEAQAAYLAAYAFDPRRAEPLFKLAEHWYGKQNHAMVYLFASRAAELPRPDSILFVDEEVYEWRAAELASISAYYLKDAKAKTRGHELARQCVRARPDDERLRANFAFYAPSALEMFPGYTSKQIDFTPQAPYVAINPSIFFDGWWRCIIRTTNYKIVNGQYLTPGDNAIYTRNYMLELYNDLSVTRAIEMIDKTEIPRSAYPVHGFEDCRLFKHAGKLHFTATVCDFDLDKASTGPREIVLGELDHDYAIIRASALRGPWSDKPQKNWMPRSGSNGFTDRNAALVYAVAPANSSCASVLDLSSEGPIGLLSTRGASLEHGRLRGGSQLVRVPGGYLCIVHEVSWPGNNARVYLHRFVLLSEGYKIISMTEPFYFEEKGIEFCAGLGFDGRRLVASFGVNDCSAHFGIFSFEAVKAALRDDFKI